MIWPFTPYPAFDEQDILDLLPGLRDALLPGGQLDAEKTTAIADAYLLASIDRMERLGKWLSEAQTLDPSIAAELEDILAMPNRVGTLAFCLPMIMGEEEHHAFQQTIMGRGHELYATSAQAGVFAGEQILRHVDAARQAGREDAVLDRLEDMARRMAELPLTELKAADIHAMQDAGRFLVKTQAKPASPVEMERKRPQIIAALETVLRYQITEARHNGYDTPLDRYLGENGVTREEWQAMSAACRRLNPGAHAGSLNVNMPMDREARFSYRQAQRLVEETFESIHPELGAIVKEAFTRPWIWIDNDAESPEGIAIAGVPARNGGHPNIRMRFTGTFKDTRTLAHEMAHLAASYLAGQELDALRFHAGSPLHETFALFAELNLIEKAVRAYGRKEGVKEWHDMECLMGNASMYQRADLQNRLFERLQQEPRSLAFDEVSRMLPGKFMMENQLLGFGTFIASGQSMVCASYPFAAYGAWQAKSAMRKDPAFGERLVAVMRRGNTLSLKEALDTLSPGAGNLSPQWFDDINRQWGQILEGLDSSRFRDVDQFGSKASQELMRLFHNGMGFSDMRASPPSWQERVREQPPHSPGVTRENGR